VLLALAAVAVNSAPIFMPAPIGDEVLDKLDNDLDNLLETAEDRYISPREKDQMARDDKIPPIKNGVVSKQEKAAENGTARDPFKQIGTYTDAMKKHEEETERRLAQRPKMVNGVRQRVGPLNRFRSAKDREARAQTIAKNIYKIVKGPVKKRVKKTALQLSIDRIKKKGIKDAKFLHRIYQKSKARDRKRRRLSQRREDRLAKEKRKPKLSILHRHIERMKAEDKKAEKGPKVADAQTIKEIEMDGLPTAAEMKAQKRAKEQLLEPRRRYERRHERRHDSKKATLLDNSEEA